MSVKKVIINSLFFLAVAVVAVLNNGNFSSDNTNIVWQGNKYESSYENALEHWNKHSDEFPEYKNLQEYTEAAENFIANPPAGTLQKKEKDGDIIYYNPRMNIFAVKSRFGKPRTMFRPDNKIDYWNSHANN